MGFLARRFALAVSAVFLVLPWGIASAEFEACLDQFPDGVTPWVGGHATGGQADFRALCFDSFAVLHSGNSLTPVFAAYRLNKVRLEDARFQSRNGQQFFPDARLPEDARAYPRDYIGSGYDKGHMAPAFDMPNPNAMAQSFSMANIVPQEPGNNRGVWKKVESHIRKMVLRLEGDIFVISGPVFCGELRADREGMVWVPDYLYKLAYHPISNQACAYWMKNSEGETNWEVITYDTLVERTGIEFLPGLWPIDTGCVNTQTGGP